MDRFDTSNDTIAMKGLTRRFPEDALADEVFIEKVRRGFRDSEEGRVLTRRTCKDRLGKWL